MNIADCHTHRPGRRDAITNAAPGDFRPEKGMLYSVGIHPWLTEETTQADTERLRRAAAHPQVAAIGETGIDALRGASAERQTEIFKTHIAISEEWRKPLILHAVKSIDQILALHKQTHPSSAWIWHGFRGNGHTAETLARRGIYMSAGEKFNAEGVKAIPDRLLLLETDESALPVGDIARLVAAARGASKESILSLSEANLQRLLTAYLDVRK